MAAITPSTNLKLLKNPNNLSNQNQIAFSSKVSQFNYFNSLQKLEVDDFTYQRKDYTIRYPACIDDILEYNYCMYQNNAYNDKWFYAYITNMRYLNDNATEITIQTDVFQTYQFDIVYKESFVEREHVSDDTIGLHTVPENLETGDYITNGVTNASIGAAHPVVMVTQYCVLTSTSDDRGYVMTDPDRILDAGATVNGVYQGCMFLLCGDDQAVRNIISAYDVAGKNDAIVGLFMAPDILTGYEDPTLSSSTMWYYTYWSGGLAYGPFCYLSSSTIGDVIPITSIAKPYTTIDGVTPKNNKCFTYPYIYLMGTNNTGISVVYQYEYFNEPSYTAYCRFKTYGVITPGGSIKTYPLYYKKETDNYSEGMPCGKLPICSWSSDIYTNWLTQNGVNIGISLASSAVQIVSGGILASTGAGAMAGASQITSGALGIASTLGSVYEHSLLPPQFQGETNSGDINYSLSLTNFSFYRMNIKAEMVNIIDKYFSMYGYKVNILKVPNINNRTNWNYVKTIGANIEGLIPEMYINEIRSLFDNGITLWHTTTHFLDYSQTNSIVT